MGLGAKRCRISFWADINNFPGDKPQPLFRDRISSHAFSSSTLQAEMPENCQNVVPILMLAFDIILAVPYNRQRYTALGFAESPLAKCAFPWPPPKTLRPVPS